MATTDTVELKNVDSYSAPGKGEPERVIRDTIAKGLRLVIRPSGKKSFLYFYRNPQGVQRKWTIGSFPALSLTSARSKVAALKDILEKAKKDPTLALSPEADPAATEQSTKREIRAPVPEDDLYPAVARLYLRDYVMGRGTKEGRKDGTIEQTGRHLGFTFEKAARPQWVWVEIRGGLAEQWKGKRFSAITKADVEHHLDDLLFNGSTKRQSVGAPVTANRTYAALKALFRWAQRKGRLAEGKRGEDITDWEGSGEAKRERFLTEDEIRVFWTATGELGYPAGTALRVILLTGCRKSEVSNMNRTELDEDLKRWTIPGGRTGRVKNRLEHTLPILPDVREILQSVPHDGKFLFSYDGGQSPMKSFTAPHAKVLKRMEELLGVTYVDDPEAPWPQRPWVPHDLRHTFSTLTNERDPSASFAVEVVLNHKIKGMAGGYNHAKYKALKYNLLEAWEADVRRILAGQERPESKDDPAVNW